jgi:hypothetical protein
MSTRTLERICIVGLLDIAYRVFLRDLVRQQLGMTAPPPRLGR